MGDVTHATVGFPGSVGDVEEAQRHSVSTAPFLVGSGTDWTVAADVAVNRQITISPGSGAVAGGALWDRTTQTATLVADPNNGTQDRYDAVIAKFSWQDPKGVSFLVVPGTTAPPQVNTSPAAVIDPSKLNRYMGVQYDGLIGMVRVRPSVGPFSAGDVISLAPWGAVHGPVNVASDAYLSFLDVALVGQVHALNTDLIWEKLANGSWNLLRWCGTDRAKQPMLSMQRLGQSMPHNQTTGVILSGTQVQHSGALLTAVSGNRGIQCNAYGRVRVECRFRSDSGNEGHSLVQLSRPASPGDLLTVLEDHVTRQSGYAGAGTLGQSVSDTVVVQPGDQFIPTVFSYSAVGIAVNYDTILTVTYGV